MHIQAFSSYLLKHIRSNTIMIPNVWANGVDMQSDQGLHCFQFCLHVLDALLYSKATLFKL